MNQYYVDHGYYRSNVYTIKNNKTHTIAGEVKPLLMRRLERISDMVSVILDDIILICKGANITLSAITYDSLCDVFYIFDNNHMTITISNITLLITIYDNIVLTTSKISKYKTLDIYNYTTETLTSLIR